jgi:hypothetical protein
LLKASSTPVGFAIGVDADASAGDMEDGDHLLDCVRDDESVDVPGRFEGVPASFSPPVVFKTMPTGEWRRGLPRVPVRAEHSERRTSRC